MLDSTLQNKPVRTRKPERRWQRRASRWLTAACLAASFPAQLAAQLNNAPPIVRVEPVVFAELAPTIPVPGTVYSRYDAKLSAEVEGNLVRISEVGEWVRKGEIFAQIDDTPLRLRSNEYEGIVARAQSRVAFLEREVARLRELASQNVAAKRQLDETESDLAVASSEVMIAKAQLEQVNDQLNRTRIRAPFDGRVTERLATLGERVSEGDPVVRLINPGSIEVIARVPLRSLDYVSEGNSVEVESDRRVDTGTVRTIVPYGDARSHMFEVRIDVDASHWTVGENVRINIPTAKAQRLLAVPRDALILRRDGASVFRIGGDESAERVQVIPGLGDGTLIAVTGELSAGDRVVVRGGERLQAGQRVQILNAPPALSSPSATAGSASN